MVKKNKETDFVGFRAKTEHQKKDFYIRAETLKDKGITKADIFEAGLLALEDGKSIEQLQRKKTKEINERDYYLLKAKHLNLHIEALNRQLINKPNGRYKDLDEQDHVLTINIFDKEGNEYKF